VGAKITQSCGEEGEGGRGVRKEEEKEDPLRLALLDTSPGGPGEARRKDAARAS